MNSLNETFERTITITEKPSTPEIDELRRLRNEAFDKSQEYQRKIDQAYLQYYKVPDIKDKWVKIYNDAYDETYIGNVKDVQRLFDGFRIKFSGVSCEYRSVFSVLKKEIEVDFDWTQSKNVEIISKGDALRFIMNRFQEILTEQTKNIN